MRRQRAIVANLGKERSALMSRVDSASRPTKCNPSGRRQSSPCRHRHMATRVASALALAFIFGWNNMKPSVERIMTEHTIRTSSTKQRAEMGRIIYGAKSKGEDTARLVTQAIQSGFRHIATVSIIKSNEHYKLLEIHKPSRVVFKSIVFIWSLL